MGQGDLFQLYGTRQGTEERGGHPVLQVEYARGPRFSYILFQGVSIAELSYRSQGIMGSFLRGHMLRATFRKAL